MNKNEQRIWEWKYSLCFFYVLIKNKELNWIYTNNVLILGIAKEKNK